VINALYFAFPLQCKNCGLRFFDREKLDKHLDWHFIQNRKEKEKLRKAISRSWMVNVNDWFTDTETAEQSGRYHGKNNI
jgi:pre-mRNA cleavage complex 2 protein Pcf11